MKQLKFRTFIIAMLLASAMGVSAEKVEAIVGDLKYEIDTETREASVIDANNKSKLQTITIPNHIKVDGVDYAVRSLGAGCFDFCTSLTSIDIPSSVTRLGSGCFECCYSLTHIIIPASVTRIGSQCFYKCYSLKSIDILAPITSLDNNCFRQCISLMSIVIPSSVTSLGLSCFEGCTSLTSVIIPYSITTLGRDCFRGCSSLKSIIIPTSVTKLGANCFRGCSSLTSIDIPASVTSLGQDCFDGCSSLTSIIIPSSVTSIGDYCFIYCRSLTSITCKIPTPLKDRSFFTNTPIENASLYVPEESIELYRTTSPWSGFGKILPITTTDINNNTVTKEITINAIYNIRGERKNGISCGLNIIRMSDGTMRKIIK